MSNARIQFSLAAESVWQAYNPQLKEGEIVTVVKDNKKVKLVQGKIGGSAYIDSTVIWDQDEAEELIGRAESAAGTATSQATAAASSATAAASSATKAANSASAAKTSETNADTSATNAKNSETAAKNSATSASTSAATATTQAGRAADSATAAAGSASQASTFASTATSKATAADQSATAADQSATAAAASAVTASDKATAAASSATAAAGSATNAAGSAKSAESLVGKANYGFLKRNTAYAVGDIAYCEQLPAGYYLECVTAGTTGNTEPTFKVGGVKVLDGSVEWNVALVASNAAVENVSGELSTLSNDIFIKAGDTLLIDGGVYINGTLTSAATQVNVTIPLNKIILASTVKLISGQMLFRQGGKYYVGSGDALTNILDVGIARAWITPIGIRLYIIFNKAVEAQNNAPVAANFSNLTFQFS